MLVKYVFPLSFLQVLVKNVTYTIHPKFDIVDSDLISNRNLTSYL